MKEKRKLQERASQLLTRLHKKQRSSMRKMNMCELSEAIDMMIVEIDNGEW